MSEKLDAMVVIRSIDEKTTHACHQLVLAEIGSDQVKTINVAPFSEAVKKTFEIGMASGRKWTLALDADILLRKNAIADLISRAESLPSNFFMIQGRVLDKLFCFSRNGGPHLFRTELCKMALELVPDSSGNHRPEGKTVNLMIEKGYHRYKGPEVYGLHDFFQSDYDIFRKAFIHGLKFRDMSKHFLYEWAQRMQNDNQYKVALIAFSIALTKDQEFRPDEHYLRNLYTSVCKNLNEENEIFIPNNIDAFMSDFRISARARSFEIQHKRILRSDKVPVNSKKSSLKKRVLTKIENWAASRQ